MCIRDSDLPIQVNDPSVELELLYIDDLIAEMLDALEGREHYCSFDGMNAVGQTSGRYCYVPTTHWVSLGQIVELLDTFKAQPQTLMLPQIPENSFAKKLYTTYLSYLPEEKISFPLKMNCDERGSFTEILKTASCGQFSVNISKPGVTKGQHWHQTKWEFFIVVSGHGLIQERKIGMDENGEPYPVLNFEVSGEKIEAVHLSLIHIYCLKKCIGNQQAFFLIVGDGTEYYHLENFLYTENPRNVKLMKRLPKEDYDQMIAACDVGLIFLDHRFTIPNFPSRVLSYMQAGIPVLACTDRNTDIGEIVVSNGFGWWCESKNRCV